MVIENVQLSVHAGQEAAFEAAMVEGRKLLESGDGCRSVRFSRGIENPSSYLLQIEWDSVEAHTAYTHTEAFTAFGALAGPFFSERPQMAHFSPID